MNELALFAGAGGGILASELLGNRTVCAVEYDEYARSVLVKRQNEGHIKPFPIWDDIRTFDAKPWRGVVELVSGGFPCQAFSTAARGKNKKEKDLWHEMFRVINEACPSFVFAENVQEKPIRRAEQDLLNSGFICKSIKLSAKDLGADHRRNRWWLLAYSDDNSKLFGSINAKTQKLPKLQNSFWKTKPGEFRVSDGVAYRMERLKATGNGQVPIVAAQAYIELMREIYE